MEKEKTKKNNEDIEMLLKAMKKLNETPLVKMSEYTDTDEYKGCMKAYEDFKKKHGIKIMVLENSINNVFVEVSKVNGFLLAVQEKLPPVIKKIEAMTEEEQDKLAKKIDFYMGKKDQADSAKSNKVRKKAQRDTEKEAQNTSQEILAIIDMVFNVRSIRDMHADLKRKLEHDFKTQTNGLKQSLE